MERDPAPSAGAAFAAGFADALRTALAVNEAVHDGAVMIGREGSDMPYRVTGWSHRLHPPAGGSAIPNRGSAFNSCAAMSQVPGVDALVLISEAETLRFVAGVAETIPA